MARYIIRTLDDDSNTVAICQRSTRTSAADAAYRFAYEALKAFGKLDTVAAHTVRNAMATWDDLLPVGDWRSLQISNTGKRVLMSRVS